MEQITDHGVHSQNQSEEELAEVKETGVAGDDVGILHNNVMVQTDSSRGVLIQCYLVDMLLKPEDRNMTRAACFRLKGWSGSFSPGITDSMIYGEEVIGVVLLSGVQSCVDR